MTIIRYEGDWPIRDDGIQDFFAGIEVWKECVSPATSPEYFCIGVALDICYDFLLVFFEGIQPVEVDVSYKIHCVRWVGMGITR